MKAVPYVRAEHGIESRERKRENRSKSRALCLEQEMEKNLGIGKLLNSFIIVIFACVSVCTSGTKVHKPKLLL